MLKITKLSATALIFYILFYLQVWGDNHIILYGTAAITVLSMGIYCFQQGHMDFSNVPFGVWNNLIMVVYSLATGFFVAYNFNAVVSSCVTYAAFSMVCVAICYASIEEGSFDWVLQVLIASAFACAMYTLFRGVYWQGYGRTLSATNNPHTFAAVMNLGIFSVAFLRRNKDNVAPALSIVLIAFFFYSIIECGSRKYLIASGCIVIIWFIAYFRNYWEKKNSYQRMVLIAVSIAFALLALFLYHKVYLQSNMHIRMQEDNAGNQNRIRYYRKAWDIFLESPFLGGGYDQFKYHTLDGSVGGYAHSTYAEAIADFGFVGCMIYFIPIFCVSYQIAKRAFITERGYDVMLLAGFCVAELLLGVGQVFFMEFYHFLAWTILFYYSKESNTESSSVLTQRAISDYSKYKYIRDI